MFLVIAQTWDRSIVHVLERYAQGDRAQEHADKFNRWHESHGREQFAYVKEVKQ
jgi:hypothetical protein